MDNLRLNSYDFQIELIGNDGIIMEVVDRETSQELDAQKFEGGMLESVEYTNFKAKLYPVPVNDVLTIELPDNTEAVLKITDIYGRTIINKKFNDGKTEENLEDLTGVYFVTIISKGQIFTRKITCK